MTYTHRQRKIDKEKDKCQDVVTDRGGSNFDVEVVVLVGHLEYERPRKLVDTYVAAVNNQSTATDAHSDCDQFRILPSHAHTHEYTCTHTHTHTCTHTHTHN